MKIKLVLLFLVFCNSAFCQHYKFDLLTNYISNQEGLERDRIVFSNSDDQSYFLLIKTMEQDNVAILVDLRTKKIHRYSFIEQSANKKMPLRFTFLNSEKLKPIRITRNYRFEFKTINEDSLFKTIRMTIYKNKRKNKIVGETELKAKKSTKNLFPLYRFSYLHLFEYRTDIDLNENVTIVSSKFLENRKFESRLANYEVIDFDLNIPEKGTSTNTFYN
jgi:hypothetical protein